MQRHCGAAVQHEVRAQRRQIVPQATLRRRKDFQRWVERYRHIQELLLRILVLPCPALLLAERKHTAAAPIDAYDILIAGQAVRSGATLVTADSREFARVRGLAWEDWTISPGP